MKLLNLLRQPTAAPEDLALGALVLLALLLGLLHEIRIGVDVVTLLVEHLKAEIVGASDSLRKLGAAIANAPLARREIQGNLSLRLKHGQKTVASHGGNNADERSLRMRNAYQRIGNLAYRRAMRRLSDEAGRRAHRARTPNTRTSSGST
jgi:hypothetical protein